MLGIDGEVRPDADEELVAGDGRRCKRAKQGRKNRAPYVPAPYPAVT
jgi:hypothetical protein